MTINIWHVLIIAAVAISLGLTWTRNTDFWRH